jgi:DNA-directed RNA polymerase subunit RPC12/RpoP
MGSLDVAVYVFRECGYCGRVTMQMVTYRGWRCMTCGCEDIILPKDVVTEVK